MSEQKSKWITPNKMICPYKTEAGYVNCTHYDGYPSVDVRETRSQVCLPCQLGKINQILITLTAKISNGKTHG